jgi:hypothetical protein
VTAPTKSDRAEFKGFCEQATDAQLANIEAKERKANRRVYATIAARVAFKRQVKVWYGEASK